MNGFRTSERMAKHPVDPQRIRKRPRQFACLDRALVYQNHIGRMTLAELALYVFLECVSDPLGLSYYSEKRIGQYLHLAPEQLRQARSTLIQKGILLYLCPIYQLLELPPQTQRSATPPPTRPPRPEAVPFSTVVESIMEGFAHANA